MNDPELDAPPLDPAIPEHHSNSEKSLDPYDIDIPNNQVPLDQVFAVEGMVVNGARRIRFAVQHKV
jgi:hypothetical protein